MPSHVAGNNQRPSGYRAACVLPTAPFQTRAVHGVFARAASYDTGPPTRDNPRSRTARRMHETPENTTMASEDVSCPPIGPHARTHDTKQTTQLNNTTLGVGVGIDRLAVPQHIGVGVGIDRLLILNNIPTKTGESEIDGIDGAFRGALGAINSALSHTYNTSNSEVGGRVDTQRSGQFLQIVIKFDSRDLNISAHPTALVADLKNVLFRRLGFPPWTSVSYT